MCSKAAYGRSDTVQQINYLSLFMSIAIIITAVALGLLSSHPKFRKFANKLGNMSGIFLAVVGKDKTCYKQRIDTNMYWTASMPCV